MEKITGLGIFLEKTSLFSLTSFSENFNLLTDQCKFQKKKVGELKISKAHISTSLGTLGKIFLCPAPRFPRFVSTSFYIYISFSKFISSKGTHIIKDVSWGVFRLKKAPQLGALVKGISSMHILTTFYDILHFPIV